MNTQPKEWFRSTAKVLISDDLAQSLPQALAEVGGGRTALIADRALQGQAAYQELWEVLSGVCPQLEVLELAAFEPQTDYVDQQVARLKDFLPEVVVGVGGGSIIDLSKAVAVLLYNPGPAAEYQGPGLIKRPGARKVMIPSTAGTGSEVTPGAVVLNPETKRKGAIGSPWVVPEVALLEPRLSLGMPETVMVSTALDAMCHCLESYVGHFYNPFAAMYAREGFGKLINAYPRVCADPQNLAARREMLVGSAMAGFAIFNTDTGACHSISYALGAYFGVPHGVANALLLPPVMAHNIDHGCLGYAELYDLVSWDEANPQGAEAKARRLQELLAELVSESGMPTDLGAYGFTREAVPDMAAKGLNLKTALGNNPVPFSYDDAARVLGELAATDLDRR